FVCRLLHLKIISLKNPLQIGLCNKAVLYVLINIELFRKKSKNESYNNRYPKDNNSASDNNST
ncbi:hypothetical protein KTH02_16850, partial [Acinetobacter radioresistens]|uniref:hypothetical protein n=1 Tax=Acinetobacter radioresistens TaxID=40216 RepID=UPI0021CD9BDC